VSDAAAGVGEAPLVAVVVPALDEERAVAACLESIGSAPGVEVVVCDGGSRDGTAAVVGRFPAARLLTGPRGRGHQLNAGAAATTASVLLFLHADCRLPPGWIEPVLAAVADPGVAVGCFRLHTEPPAGRGRRAPTRLWWRLLDLRSRGFGLPYGDQALFLRRSTFDRVGGFAEIPLMEDVEMVRRCLRRGRLARLPLEVRTTARRFARRPVLARLATATFPFLFRCGVSPERLARWYGDPR
jgi:rSAM/selenodomain-associated transferase 2